MTSDQLTTEIRDMAFHIYKLQTWRNAETDVLQMTALKRMVEDLRGLEMELVKKGYQ